MNIEWKKAAYKRVRCMLGAIDLGRYDTVDADGKYIGDKAERARRLSLLRHNLACLNRRVRCIERAIEVEEKLKWQTEHLARLCPMFDGGFDLYCFSVVFSWRLPALVEMVRMALRLFKREVWIGGPAVSFHAANYRYVENQTGIKPTRGIDDRFETQPTDCPMVYFSRGCPAYTTACGHCPVPTIEGTDFRFYRDARPAKLLLDNNLSALPCDYQDFIIRRYADEWRGGHVDANSGFEPHTFTAETLERWRRFPLACWRFGYDDLSEREQALDMLARLRAAGYKSRKIRVYTLIGNEPIADCHRRIREVIAAGGEPVPQRLRPLNWLGPPTPLPCRHDWSEPALVAYQRFYTCPQLWRTMKPEEFFYQGRYPLRVA